MSRRVRHGACLLGEWNCACKREPGHLKPTTTVQISSLIRRPHALQTVRLWRPVLLDPVRLLDSVSIWGSILTPIAVVAGVLGAWRFGADLGWTSKFLVAEGLLSRYQVWFAIAIGAQTSASILNRWVADQDKHYPSPPRRLALTDLAPSTSTVVQSTQLPPL
jgi:hypothetical protein